MISNKNLLKKYVLFVIFLSKSYLFMSINIESVICVINIKLKIYPASFLKNIKPNLWSLKKVK